MPLISTPGKFEGEPTFVPDFWDRALEGGADEDDGRDYVFHLTDEDREKYPDLGDADLLVLYESENGFVFSDLFSHDEWERVNARRELENADGWGE